ncbi:hypothetical protein E2C01_057456 [Portunus trituberculatus]|uniref:Uncharacterized protein n=1 Tax=Portunus trituberculatus TaxID=210409 RepID=A0A5B7H2G4_PORTR|nr:hypothetical protein [Portunus trituberculatus]
MGDSTSLQHPPDVARCKQLTCGKTVTTLELYDLHDVSRRITVTLIRNTAQSKRNSVIKVKSFGREIFINMGYDFTPGKFCINFLLSWAEDRKIEFDISWKDVSKGFSKEQILKGKFSQPFRTVLLDGYYMRNNRNITAFLKFNWDAMNPSKVFENTYVPYSEDLLYTPRSC